MTSIRRHIGIITLFVIISRLNAVTYTLPRVEITCDTTYSSTHFVPAQFKLVAEDTLRSLILLRRRGASSLRYDKPSFAIKLIDSLGNKVDTSLLSMRKDNYWVLDGMCTDLARMRNRAAMDLWLEIAPPLWYQDVEPKAQNGYDGKMVEVWYNGAQMGIYCLMERVDRKQLQLKKYNTSKGGIRGVLYKTVNWSNVSFSPFTESPPVETNPTWTGWEIKYPGYDEGEPITWQPLMDHYTIITQSDSTLFSDSIANYIDILTFIRYTLFVEVLSARDNGGKNNYWSFYNTQLSHKATISMWDIDHAWGRMYNGQPENTDYRVLSNHYLSNKLYAYYPHYQESLKTHYTSLRTSAFSIDHLDSILDTYFSLYRETGMDTIENQLWNNHNNLTIDIASEQQYIHEWLLRRLAFLDSIYLIPNDTIQKIGNTYVPFDRNSIIAVYDLHGRMVSSTLAPSLPSGIYILRYRFGKSEKIVIP